MIMAFLQNAYTSSEESAKKLEDLFADPNLVGRMQYCRKEGLFEGRNYTGLLLKRTFGALMCDSIWWENASPRWGWKSSHKFPADRDHIVGLLESHRPAIVLTFGKVAGDALAHIQKTDPWHGILLRGPHPASRQPTKYAELSNMVRMLLAHDVEPCPYCGKLGQWGSHCEICSGQIDKDLHLREKV